MEAILVKKFVQSTKLKKSTRFFHLLNIMNKFNVCSGWNRITGARNIYSDRSDKDGVIATCCSPDVAQSIRAKHCPSYVFGLGDRFIAAMLRPYKINTC
jgi:hypothetical protein